MSEVRTLVIDGKDVAATRTKASCLRPRKTVYASQPCVIWKGSGTWGPAGCAWWRSRVAPSSSPPALRTSRRGWRSGRPPSASPSTGRGLSSCSSWSEITSARSASPITTANCRTGHGAGPDPFRARRLCTLELDVDASHERFVLDQNRCILCTRCVRVCDEIEGAHTWDIKGRGVNARLVSDLGQPWGSSTTCTSCGKCVQVCPTGALSEKGRTVAEAKARRPYLPYLVGKAAGP